MEKGAVIKYKLTDQDMQTHQGFQWVLNKKQTIDIPGNHLCSDEVFHFYDSPEMAVLMNPIHANIKNPRLFKVSCNQVSHDGTKGGSKWMVLKQEIALPVFTTNQKVAFAIYCSLSYYKEKSFVSWAENWLSGKDRSARATAAAYDAADAAYNAAYAAARATAAAAADAAADAARAADAAAAAKIFRTAIKKALLIK